jgi:polyhydroxyalkanoate synthase
VHLAGSPGKQHELLDAATRNAGRLGAHVWGALADPTTPACIQPLPQDHRFDDDAWA